jgi:hypothetical protein
MIKTIERSGAFKGMGLIVIGMAPLVWVEILEILQAVTRTLIQEVMLPQQSRLVETAVEIFIAGSLSLRALLAITLTR